MTTLGELLRRPDQPWASVSVPDLAIHTAQVRPGDVFVALAHPPQLHRHIRRAAECGAAAVLYDPAEALGGVPGDCGVPTVPVQHLRHRIGDLAGRLWGDPSAELTLYGVTGTNGKSTTVHYIAELCSALGIPTAFGGTLGVRLPGDSGFSDDFAGHTTPPVTVLQRTLARLHGAGCRAAALEVSSHALDQNRIQAVRFDCAVFINLSRDHLDYHCDMLDYSGAKARLFSSPGVRIGVVNADDDYAPQMLRALDASAERIRFGRGCGADLRLERIAISPDGGYDLGLIWRGRIGAVRLASYGRFNVDNLMAAMAAVLATTGRGFEEVLECSAALTDLPGRMQRIGAGAPLVLVDYAHTPDALHSALCSLHEHAAGPFGCVFGCGGERDVGKRAEMGRIAGKLADWIVLTDDNPRGEDPAGIVADIRSGLPPDADVTVCHGRAEAIGAAVERAVSTGSALLIAGRGHEAWQEVAGARMACDDIQLARSALGG
ncbi:MAG: UDP-N-acetylmuramoyl-L-alanyl-D-glutamate--2,6-diaminopimelate ligase [Gammaproteobacteria bacterium AqS3]|nr:UDP-N-acetylmuramoyl-L-alanyl-D-glutamate--2,6-diaminopimelate ligase [Gammaproteobacteria bacterium AqS3]